MIKKTKVWLGVATVLAVVGVLLFVVAMSVVGWNFKKLSTDKIERKTYEITETFNGISVNVRDLDITIVRATDDTCKVVCDQRDKYRYTVGVQDGMLVVCEVDTRKWYEKLGINLDSPTLTLYLPSTEYASLAVKGATGDVKVATGLAFAGADIVVSTGDIKWLADVTGCLKIKTSTGDVCVEQVTVGALDITVSTGKVTLSSVQCNENVTIAVDTGDSYLRDIVCQNFSSRGTTGDIALHAVVITNKLVVQRTTGDVTFNSSDADEIVVNTDTGDVKGNLRSGKAFVTKTSTGRVSVPQSIVGGGLCTVTTSTGDIVLTVS